MVKFALRLTLLFSVFIHNYATELWFYRIQKLFSGIKWLRVWNTIKENSVKFEIFCFDSWVRAVVVLSLRADGPHAYELWHMENSRKCSLPTPVTPFHSQNALCDEDD